MDDKARQKIAVENHIDFLLKKNNSKVISKEKYNKIVSLLKAGVDRDEKNTAKFRWTVKNKGYQLVNFDCLSLKDVLCVPACSKSANDRDLTILGKWRRIIHQGDIFDVVNSVHSLHIGHLGYKKTMHEIQRSYAGITRSVVEVFIKYCPTCQLSTVQTNAAPLKPILANGFMARLQIDLIDMRDQPDQEFKWIAHVMDHWSKFHVLWPMKRKTAQEVANGLEERVFATLGLPRILQSDNGREFVNEVIEEVLKKWGGKDVLFINGRPRHCQSQGLVEQGNYTVEKQIANYRTDLNMQNGPCPWSTWLPQIQLTLNTMRSEATKQTAYELVFGQPYRGNIFPGARCRKGNTLLEEDYEEELASQNQTEEPLHDILVPSPPTPSEEIPENAVSPLASVGATSGSPENVPVDLTIPSAFCEAQTNLDLPEPALCAKDDLSYHNLPEPQSKSDQTPSRHADIRARADLSYHKTAELMKLKYNKRKRTTCKEFLLGDSVTLKIPKIDRSGSDQPRLKCIIIHVANGLYTLETEHGQLKNKYRAGDLMPFSGEVNVSSNQSAPCISLREAARKESGRLYAKKSCKCRVCSTQCVCRRQGLTCSTHCHPRRTCSNKDSKTEALGPKTPNPVTEAVLQVTSEDFDALIKSLLTSALPLSLPFSWSKTLNQMDTPIVSLVHEFLYSGKFGDEDIENLLEVINSKAKHLFAEVNTIQNSHKRFDVLQLAGSLLLLSYLTQENRLLDLLETLKPVPSILEMVDEGTPCIPTFKIVIGNNSADPSDLQSLIGENWLNDKVVHAYLGLLAQSSFYHHEGPGVLILPCFLASMWRNGNYTTWLYEDIRLVDYKFILLPVCESDHWFLLAVDIERKVIDILDSVENKSRKNTFQQHWMRFVKERNRKDDITVSEWTLGNVRSNQQEGTCDCGVFVLMNAEAIVKSVPVGIFRQCHVSMFRKYALTKIIRQSRRYDEKVCDMPFCSHEGFCDWVQCEKCQAWVHTACEGITLSAKQLRSRKIHHVCSLCKSKPVF